MKLEIVFIYPMIGYMRNIGNKMLLFAPNASIILYNVLNTLDSNKIFLLPLNICTEVFDIFLNLKLSVEFIDISNETLCMDENLLYDKLKNSDKYGGVLFVKSYGVEYNTEHIFKNIKDIDKNIFIIDDRCLSNPEFEYDINQSKADIVLYSTGYSKYIDIDFGGFGYVKEEYKFNFNKVSQMKFSEYRDKVERKRAEVILHKNILNDIYQKGLPKDIRLEDKFNNWRFNILIDRKKEVLQDIFNNNLFASSHYKPLEHGYESNAKILHNKVINLFNDFRFNVENAKKIVRIIRNENIILWR